MIWSTDERASVFQSRLEITTYLEPHEDRSDSTLAERVIIVRLSSRNSSISSMYLRRGVLQVASSLFVKQSQEESEARAEERDELASKLELSTLLVG